MGIQRAKLPLAVRPEGGIIGILLPKATGFAYCWPQYTKIIKHLVIAH